MPRCDIERRLHGRVVRTRSLAQCQEYNDITISSCSEDEIFIQCKPHNNSTIYVAYTPGIEANYNIQTIYGHDNLCLPKSNICNANFQG